MSIMPEISIHIYVHICKQEWNRFIYLTYEPLKNLKCDRIYDENDASNENIC